ncbi:MAG TPA: M3 family oligoendopeptidase [Actinomycetota bacterium]|nr:M3 family oligoendopeptidase [Actinomycetota bacterium]
MSATVSVSPLRWDMSVVFPSLDSPDFADGFEDVVRGVGELRDLYDRLGVRAGGDAPASAVEEAIERTNDLSSRVRTLVAYVSAFVTTDSRDETAQARMSELQVHLVELAKLGKRFEAWIGTSDLDAVLAGSEVAREHAFALRKAAEGARRQMSEPEEDLAASLAPAGPTPWGRLHGDITSRLLVELDHPSDGQVRLPMSAVRALAADPDARVREAAYRAELATWETVEVPVAAAINSIKGWHNVLNERRGWPDSLEPALFANNVDRTTLEAMQEAVTESFPDLRRYLKAKARLLGRDSLPWFDLFAPLGAEGRSWAYTDATGFILERFGSYSDSLAALARRAFDERWIDAEPRPGKRDGAFCMSLRADESRVLLNHTDSFNSVSTLAHELGHAYHNVQLASRTEMNRRTPMALAETASIFCQTIVTNAMLADAAGDEKLAILEAELQGACQIVVDIHSRFLFESAVFERRRSRDLSVSELKETMLEAQRQTYGDGLAPDALHPYMWAAKPHYYSSSFYNWPYTFGMLFGLALYARYTQDPEGFRAGYDELLSCTGLADAAELGRRFDIDFASVATWRSSLGQIRARVYEFEELAR